MADLLPNIDFKVSQRPAVVLSTISRLCGEGALPNFSQFGDIEHLSGITALNLNYLAASEHEGLIVQLISDEDETDRVVVETWAHHWATTFPSYKAYESVTREIVRPILRAYNTEAGSRCRLRIRARRIGTTPTLRTINLFERFGRTVNTTALHPSDWDRFYRLVLDCRQRLDIPTLAALLHRSGFKHKKSEELAYLFGHLKRFRSLSNGGRRH